jgi:predicted transposase YdaD
LTIPANRKFKDSLFSNYFHDTKRVIELFNAINNTNISQNAEINFQTLTNVLICSLMNDLAFDIENKIVVLIEHQSSVNQNMPVRLLMYIGRIYEKILTTENIYRKKLIKIPKPEFIVLYNGEEKQPDMFKLRLSDAFIEVELPAALELEVTVYNINVGHNAEIMKRSEALSDYAAFVGKVREYLYARLKLDDAVSKAIQYCVGHDIMKEFLKRHISEVYNMLMAEFNIEEARKIWIEEAWEDGRERGIEQGLEQGIEQGLERGIEQGLERGIERGIEQGLERGIEEGLNLKAIEAAVIIIKKWRASLTEAMESVQLDPKYRDHVIAELNKQGIIYTV